MAEVLVRFQFKRLVVTADVWRTVWLAVRCRNTGGIYVLAASPTESGDLGSRVDEGCIAYTGVVVGGAICGAPSLGAFASNW